MNRNGKDWSIALALITPMLVFFAGYLFNHTEELYPTGFIQYDNISYIAYAQQYLDGGSSGLFYKNPFNDSGEYAAIYFQPQTILFALALKGGIPAGAILIPFTLLSALVCFRIMIAIYDQLYPQPRFRSVTLILFAWGGGLLAIAGFTMQFFHPAVDSVFFLDPGQGWWGLNLGRALFFSCEAYYHMLFLGVVLGVLRRKWLLTLGLMALLSLSHPFTGIELLGIMIVWSLLERLITGSKFVPLWYIVCTIILTIFHFYYYLLYLPSFPDHQSIQEQYALNWRLRFFNMIPAYSLVGLLTLVSLWRKNGNTLDSSFRRLLWTWMLVAFAFANHEILINPMQPIHFTRGYIWTSLFLLGVPGLHYFMEKFTAKRSTSLLAAVLVIALLSDNLVWISMQAAFRAEQNSTRYLKAEEMTVLEVIRSNSDETTLVVGQDDIPYLSTVYSKAYPWKSHPFTTPFASRKAETLNLFLNAGIIPAEWRGRHILFVLRKPIQIPIPAQAVLLAETRNYFLYSKNAPINP